MPPLFSETNTDEKPVRMLFFATSSQGYYNSRTQKMLQFYCNPTSVFHSHSPMHFQHKSHTETAWCKPWQKEHTHSRTLQTPVYTGRHVCIHVFILALKSPTINLLLSPVPFKAWTFHPFSSRHIFLQKLLPKSKTSSDPSFSSVFWK